MFERNDFLYERQVLKTFITMTATNIFPGDFASNLPRSVGMRPFRTHLSCCAHPPSSHCPQVAQCKQRRHLSRLGIHANVCLNPHVQVVAFLGLVHLGIALARQCVDLSPRACGQVVALGQVTEVQDRGLIRQATACQRQPCKLPHRLNVIQRFFHRQISQCKPMAHEMNAQHRLKRIRRASAFAFGIHRLNQRQQARPGTDLIHLVEKLLALGKELCIGKSQLAHVASIS